MDLQEPAHLLEAREQPRRRGMPELAHAEAGQIVAHPDHAGIGQASKLPVIDVGTDERDALQPSVCRPDAVGDAVVHRSVRLRGDDQPVRKAVGIEQGEKAIDRADLTRIGAVVAIGQGRIVVPEKVRVAIGPEDAHQDGAGQDLTAAFIET
jgi:hypothetical protein